MSRFFCIAYTNLACCRCCWRCGSTGLLEIGRSGCRGSWRRFVADDFRFALARRYGIEAARWPKFYRALEHTRTLDGPPWLAYLFVYRYVLGLRSIGALPVGLSDIKPLKFRWVSGLGAHLDHVPGPRLCARAIGRVGLARWLWLDGFGVADCYGALAWRLVQRFNQNS